MKTIEFKDAEKIICKQSRDKMEKLLFTVSIYYYTTELMLFVLFGLSVVFHATDEHSESSTYGIVSGVLYSVFRSITVWLNIGSTREQIINALSVMYIYDTLKAQIPEDMLQKIIDIRFLCYSNPIMSTTCPPPAMDNGAGTADL